MTVLLSKQWTHEEMEALASELAKHKPSEIIRMALNDMSCLVTEGHIPLGVVWLERSDVDPSKCLFCFAGGLMMKRLGYCRISWQSEMSPTLNRMANALNHVRIGSLHTAVLEFYSAGNHPPLTKEQSDLLRAKEIHYYASDDRLPPMSHHTEFHASMEQIIGELESVGL